MENPPILKIGFHPGMAHLFLAIYTNVMLVTGRVHHSKLLGSSRAKRSEVLQKAHGLWDLALASLVAMGKTGNIGMNIRKIGDEYGANIVRMHENYENNIPTTSNYYIHVSVMEIGKIRSSLVSLCCAVYSLAVCWQLGDFPKGSRTPKGPLYWKFILCWTYRTIKFVHICFPTLDPARAM